MERKKAIWLALLMNTGLLAVLFITALAREEETPRSLARADKDIAAPLFQKTIDLPRSTPSLSTGKEGGLAQQTPPVQEVEPVVHKLPEPVIAHPVIPSSSPLSTLKKPSGDSHQQIVVKKGDSLEKLAKIYHTSVNELLEINGLSGSFLRVGQTLKVPQHSQTPALKATHQVEKKGGGEFYTVKVGDNPWTIAMKHHMKVEELLRLNELDEEKARKLRPGDRLKVR